MTLARLRLCADCHYNRSWAEEWGQHYTQFPIEDWRCTHERNAKHASIPSTELNKGPTHPVKNFALHVEPGFCPLFLHWTAPLEEAYQERLAAKEKRIRLKKAKEAGLPVKPGPKPKPKPFRFLPKENP